MRALHKVTPNEQLVAQGEYKYQLVGKPSGLKEFWSLHRTTEGDLVHRAEVRGQAAAIKVKQMTYLVLTADYRPKQLEMRQQISENEARTKIICHETTVAQTITIDQEKTKSKVEVPSGYSLFLPPVSAHGFILQRYDMQAKGRQALPLVNVRIQPKGGLSLSVESVSMDYEYLNDEEIETLAGRFACRHFMRYDQHMEQQLWLDQNGLVIQWSVPYSPIMKWDYLLVKYQREM